MNVAYGYCRVSSNLCSSLESQEKIIRKYADANDINVTRMYREMSSAYKKIPFKLSTLRGVTNRKIMFMSVDRFIRNIQMGSQFAEDLLRNNNELHFIREGIILNELYMTQWEDFLYHLRLAQEESDIKSNRMRFRMMQTIG